VDGVFDEGRLVGGASLGGAEIDEVGLDEDAGLVMGVVVVLVILSTVQVAGHLTKLNFHPGRFY
jgi:hypothetical protein